MVSWNKVACGDNTRPAIGTWSEKGWEPLV